MQQIELWGKPTLRWVYGNQSTLQSQKWKEWCLRYALQPVHHIALNGAKNATDIALTVQAVDLSWQYKSSIVSFCLVTGDQDFTALVLRLRSQGCNVYCIGKPTKSEALAKVCTEFISTDQFAGASAPKTPSTEIPSKKAPTSEMSPQKKKRDPQLTELLTQAAQNMLRDKKLEWVTTSRLAGALKLLHPAFQAKTYGFKNLPELLQTCTDIFEIRKPGDHLEVRLKM